MSIKQISVFIENVTGRLAEVTAILGDAGVNLRAVTIADTADFGILRIIADNTDVALKALERHNFTAKVTQVLGIEVPDSPGGLAKVMKVFETCKLNIEYLYASLERNKDNAIVIFKVEDLAYGEKVIKENNLSSVDGF